MSGFSAPSATAAQQHSQANGGPFESAEMELRHLRAALARAAGAPPPSHWVKAAGGYTTVGTINFNSAGSGASTNNLVQFREDQEQDNNYFGSGGNSSAYATPSGSGPPSAKVSPCNAALLDTSTMHVPAGMVGSSRMNGKANVAGAGAASASVGLTHAAETNGGMNGLQGKGHGKAMGAMGMSMTSDPYGQMYSDGGAVSSTTGGEYDGGALSSAESMSSVNRALSDDSYSEDSDEDSRPLTQYRQPQPIPQLQ